MRLWTFGLVALASSAAGVAQAQSTYEATITRTTYGIPHIEAGTWQGVGYGVAYAYAQDNICMLAEAFVTAAGERSLYFGPEGATRLGSTDTDNVTSDVFHRDQLRIEELRANAAAGQTPEGMQLIEGYAAGYNRYLRDTGVDNLPEACRGAEWVRPITTDDLLRSTEKSMLRASAVILGAGLANAAPPGEQTAHFDVTIPTQEESELGSNGWAFGSDATADGKGLLIGNPHFPWEGPSRFWQMHVRGPDGYDVMGVGLAGTPLPTLGFNKDVAWTHTVTAARHFAIYALTLSADDPTSYTLDGETVKMEAREVSVPMPGGAEPVVRTLYSSKFGDIVTVPGTPFGWNARTAFALRDANAGNQRALEAWLGIGKARTVADVESAVSETLGIPWVNTIAADREGNALHADVTTVPNVTTQLVEQCSTPFTALAASLVVLLDGSRSECDSATNPTTAAYPGLLPADLQASRIRKDYVTNSNDSYWISNASSRYEKLSPILGPHSNQLSLRTRSNFLETELSLSEAKMDHDRAKALVFGNESLGAALVARPLVTMCEGAQGLEKACAALAGWNRKFENDSRGAYLFVKFWNIVRGRKDLWQIPFDAEQPLATPRRLVTDGVVAEQLLEALGQAATDIEAEGLALDAAWGDVQFRADGEEQIAIHGGPGTAGVLNMQRSREVAGGITPVHGSSYIQIVGFDDEGPVADAILSYSQSTNPASAHYADQTRNYAAKDWHRLPFSDAEIEAAKIGETLKLSE